MRHDPAGAAILIMLRSLKMPGMAQAVHGFDFAAGEIDEAPVSQLHRCQFMDAAENVVSVGGPGTGKRNGRRQQH